MSDDIFNWARRNRVSQEAVNDLLRILDPGLPGGECGPEKSEGAVQAALQIAAAKRGAALWRNNSGATLDAEGRMVRYGLANTSSKLNKRFKSSDLIGITPVTISELHVGRVLGVFTAVEVKAPGWKQIPSDDRAAAQAAFLGVVKSKGGIGTFAQSVKDMYP